LEVKAEFSVYGLSHSTGDEEPWVPNLLFLSWKSLSLSLSLAFSCGNLQACLKVKVVVGSVSLYPSPSVEDDKLVGDHHSVIPTPRQVLSFPKKKTHVGQLGKE
jgi:hypothetical protein